jgi:nucleotide-binding universal stress UspA family protein
MDRRDGSSVILVGVDGSDPSLRAAAYAGGLARRQGSALIVVFVRSIPPSAGLVPEVLPAVVETFEHTEQELRDQVVAGAEELGVRAEFLARRGDAYVEITRVADERWVDLIVVGASAARHHQYVGSVAFRLVRAGRWPVTIVP